MRGRAAELRRPFGIAGGALPGARRHRLPCQVCRFGRRALDMTGLDARPGRMEDPDHVDAAHLGSAGPVKAIFGPKATFGATVMSEKTAWAWNAKPICLLAAGRALTPRSSTAVRLELAVSKPAGGRGTLVIPPFDCPGKRRNSPFRADRPMLCTAAARP